MKALRRYVPAFGTHHVVVILANGLTLPPLFFGQGGVRAFFSALKEVCSSGNPPSSAGSASTSLQYFQISNIVANRHDCMYVKRVYVLTFHVLFGH